MKIRVTKKDIKEGKPKSCAKCPIALAVTRKTGYRWILVGGCVDVYKSRRKMADEDSYKTAILPLDAHSFIRRFDQGYPVEPFTFDLTFEDA